MRMKPPRKPRKPMKPKGKPMMQINTRKGPVLIPLSKSELMMQQRRR